MTEERKVSLVVDREYGPRLGSLVDSGAVWIVDTEVNRKAAEECRQSDSKVDVTTFKTLEDDSASEICEGILPTLDLHHGEYSGGYSVLEVIGVKLSDDLRARIEEFGFSNFESTAEGFRASR